MGIEIALLVIGFLAFITNGVIIKKIDKRKHMPTTLMDPNSQPPRRIFTVNVRGLLSSIEQENAGERMAEFWSEEPPPPYQEFYEVGLPPAYSATNIN